MWVDLILPSARQRDKCFVLLFLYIAIKYMFTPVHVLPYTKGSASGRLFKAQSAFQSWRQSFIRGAKICIYLLCDWNEEILGSTSMVLFFVSHVASRSMLQHHWPEFSHFLPILLATLIKCIGNKLGLLCNKVLAVSSKALPTQTHQRSVFRLKNESYVSR